MDTLANQLVSGVVLAWPNVVLMLTVFVLLIYKPDRLRSPALLRTACLLFAISVVLPPIGNLIVSPKPTPMATSPTNRNTVGTVQFYSRVINALHVLAFAGAFLSLVGSIRTPADSTVEHSTDSSTTSS